MFNKKTFLSLFLIMVLVLTSCGKKEKKAENEKLKEAIETSENIEKEISKKKEPKK